MSRFELMRSALADLDQVAAACLRLRHEGLLNVAIVEETTGA